MWLKGQLNASVSQKPTVHFVSRTCLTSLIVVWLNVPILVLVLIIIRHSSNCFLRLRILFSHPERLSIQCQNKLKNSFVKGFTSKRDLNPLHTSVLLRQCSGCHLIPHCGWILLLTRCRFCAKEPVFFDFFFFSWNVDID